MSTSDESAYVLHRESVYGSDSRYAQPILIEIDHARLVLGDLWDRAGMLCGPCFEVT
ncbi:hypothetical protein CERSUDRAFT_85313 [Gelatoporia subvermispora B]|uniref:Uncharacterized protein n=1 Tax=Ceriporiopsis subvermispora (strain B) TaxID=914234 RepID=M2R960_CERS8|nr:hypothetical protein CERSUDRAFT_85313 [Gelatoporia subvermispora B]